MTENIPQVNFKPSVFEPLDMPATTGDIDIICKRDTIAIKVLRENVISQLASIKDDNVSIAGIAIERRKLLEALRLQTQAGTDMLTIEYGKVSWEYKYQNKSDGTWEYKPQKFEPTPCIHISCNHTVMSFMDHPKQPRYGKELTVIPLNFVDRKSYVKQELRGIPLDTQELINALTYALHGVATEETRPVLCCVLFDSGGDVLKLVSADGFRLPMVSMPANGIPTDKVLVHSGDIKKLLTFLKSKATGKGKGKYYPEVYLQYDYKTIKFASDNGTIEIKKQTGAFPDYEQLILKDDGSKIEFIASDMRQAINSVANIANDDSGIIRLHFEQGEPVGKVVASAKSEEYGESTVECDATVEYSEYHNANPCHIAANNRYLLDLLRLCGDSKVTLKVTNPSSPMLFEIGDNKQAIIMPMFVQWESIKDFKTNEADRVINQTVNDDKPPDHQEINERREKKLFHKPNNQKRRQILEFARDNNLVIHPGGGFEYYISAFAKCGHCPCAKTRLDCPCPESIEEVKKDGWCKCHLFWRDLDTYKESNVPEVIS